MTVLFRSFVDGDVVFHYSTDGVTWTRVTGDPELFSRSDSCGNDFSIQAVSVVYANERFVVVGRDHSSGWTDPWPCADSERSSYVWIGEPAGS